MSEASLFQGQKLSIVAHPDKIFEIVLDAKGESANVLNTQALGELDQAVAEIEKLSGTAGGIKGLMISAATTKDAFVLGADITQFLAAFEMTDAEFEPWLSKTHSLFNRIEDLKCPTVALIHGFALGGGCELSLACDFRLGTPQTKIGLPETKLGIYPGWGGTIRLSRLIGPDNAVEWIAGGKPYGAVDALKYGTLDAIVAPDQLRIAGIKLLTDANAGKFDYLARRTQKQTPLKLSKTEALMTFSTSKAFVGAQAGPNYPAPLAAIDAMEKGATLNRDEAQKIEIQGFMKMAKTPAAAALVGIFLGDQLIKKGAKLAAASGKKVTTSAVLGAGIMGGGVAYQSASSKVPIIMKDIKDEALALGMKEAAKLLEKRVEKAQIKASEMAMTLSMIRPTLSMSELKNVDFVVEAVVENEKIKKSVLAETEASLREDAVLASNTSTISITRLSEGLKRPENFCGMHFFNPVHRMPLVEIIRGAKTSEKTISTAVAYAAAMGKSPIVVNDCPGFLVNRVLFPYFGGFILLMRDGVGFERIDKVMEKFGWPMGPAYLLDVVGIDTAHHALEVMSQGFPDRMKYDFPTVLDAQYEAKRYGQKNGKGFFNYTQDPKGKPVKAVDPEVHALLKPRMTGNIEVTDADIIDRMMLPLVFECSRCLEDKIVSSAIEVDMACLYGIGFPPFRGGPMRYADAVGAKALVDLSKKYAGLGEMYRVTKQIETLAQNGGKFL